MPISFDINNLNCETGTQLAANTLNTNINNVVKFYRAMIESIQTFYTSTTVHINDDISQSTLNTIIDTAIKNINNLRADRGIQIVDKVIGHLNTYGPYSQVGPSNNVTNYGVSMNVPVITTDSYGHVTNLYTRYISIPIQYVTPITAWSGTRACFTYYNYININSSVNFRTNDIIEIQLAINAGGYHVITLSGDTFAKINSTSNAYVENIKYDLVTYTDPNTLNSVYIKFYYDNHKFYYMGSGVSLKQIMILRLVV